MNIFDEFTKATTFTCRLLFNRKIPLYTTLIISIQINYSIGEQIFTVVNICPLKNIFNDCDYLYVIILIMTLNYRNFIFTAIITLYFLQGIKPEDINSTTYRLMSRHDNERLKRSAETCKSYLKT